MFKFNRIKRINIDHIIMYAAIVVTVLSFCYGTLFNILMLGLWAVFTFVRFLEKKIRINNFAVIMAFCFVLAFVSTKLLFVFGYYTSENLGVGMYLRNCILFYIVGFNTDTDEKTIKGIIISLMIGITVFAIIFFPTVSRLSDDFYMFGAKNQSGQFFGMGAMLGLLIIPKYMSNTILKIAALCSGTLCFISLLYVHSRTPLVALTLVAVIFFISKKNKKTSDYIMALAVLLIVAVIIYLFGGLDFLSQLFESRNYIRGSSELDNVMSGRLSLWEIALSDFYDHPFTGVGAWAYIDNFVINLLRCGGLILTAIVLPVTYGKMLPSFCKAGTFLKNEEMQETEQLAAQTLRCFIVLYFFISLGEGNPPLGPGTSTFFLWIMFGLFDKLYKEHENA